MIINEAIKENSLITKFIIFNLCVIEYGLN